MKRRFWMLAPALLVLAACSTATEEPPVDQGMPVPGEDTEEMVALADELFVFNWADYIDEELLTRYEEQFGVTIVYDTYDSNEDLLAKLQAGGTGYDVIFPSDYMVAQMIDLGLLAELDFDNIPNFANIAQENKDPAYDPGNLYSVPYFWGTTGIGYDAAVVDPAPDSWAWIFEPELLEQYAGNGINVLDDQREVIGAALKYLGYSVNSQSESELREAQELIMQARQYWTSFDSTGYIDNLMIPGEIVLSHAWNGDVLVAQEEDEDWVYVIPEEGAVIWQDNMVIPATSTGIQKRTAEHFINFMLDAEVAGQNTNYVYYASPNQAAEAFIDPAILEDPASYPSEETRAKLEWIEELPGDVLELYDRIWTEIKAGP